MRRRLIPYAGYESPAKFQRRVPVARALELRALGMGWKEVAWELTQEFDTDRPFTVDGIQGAVQRATRKETA